MDPISVQKGDNLTKIAKNYDTTVDELLKLNPKLKDRPNLIFAGEKINVPKPPSETPYPGLGVERENNELPKAPWQEGYEEGGIPKATVKEDSNESAARENTTLGTALTLGAKGYLKRAQIKAMPKDIKNQATTAKRAASRTLKNAKGKIAKAKAHNIRNTAAGKIREARKATANFKSEEAKLKELQQKAKAAKGEAKKELQRQIQKQKDILGQARAKKVAKQEAAAAAKRKVTKNVNKAVGKGVTKKAAAKAATKGIVKKAAGKASGKAVAKVAGKAAGKTVLKKIPGVGLIAGLAFAADRAMHGDFTGAAMEVASGAVSCVPGLGTAASVAIDVGLGAKDLHDAKVI